MQKTLIKTEKFEMVDVDEMLLKIKSAVSLGFSCEIQVYGNLNFMFLHVYK